MRQKSGRLKATKHPHRKTFLKTVLKNTGSNVTLLTFLRNTATRAKVVEDWARDGGVLLMGYEMYRLLSLKKSFVAGRKKKNKKTISPVVIDLDEEDRQQELLKGGRDEGE